MIRDIRYKPYDWSIPNGKDNMTRTNRSNRDICPTCKGICEKIEPEKSDNTDCGYCGTAEDPDAMCDNCWKLLCEYGMIPRYISTAHEDVRNALEIITSLINHLPDSKGTEDWEWCWNELRDYSQASVKEARKVAKDFVYEMINKYKSTDDQTQKSEPKERGE